MPPTSTDIERDGKSPRSMLSMRTKVSIGGLCFFLVVGLTIYWNLPQTTRALARMTQGATLAENESQPPEQDALPELPEQEAQEESPEQVEEEPPPESSEEEPSEQMSEEPPKEDEPPQDLWSMSGPELVWKMYDEPESSYQASGIVGCEDGGFIIAANIVREINRLYPYAVGFEEDFSLVKIDDEGARVWERIYGEDDNRERVDSIVSTGDGGFILAGASEGQSCLLKVDGSGKEVWEKTYGDKWRILYSMVQCSSGGFVAVGITHNDSKAYFLRFDNEGEKVWEHTLLISVLIDVVESSDGGFIALGQDSVRGSPYVVKVDGSGEKIWEKNYTRELDEATGILRSSDGGYVVIGDSTFKIDGSGNRVWTKPYGETGGACYPPPCNWVSGARAEGGYVIGSSGSWFKIDEKGDKVWEKKEAEWYGVVGVIGTDDYGFVLVGDVIGDLWVKKIDSKGEEVWNRVYGRATVINDIAISPDENYVVAGLTQHFGTGTRDAYLSGINRSNGYKLWEKSYGGPGWDSLECIIESGDEGYIVAGYTTSFGKGGRDVYVLRVDGEGNKVWEAAYGTSQQDSAVAIVPSDDGGFVVVGNTESLDSQVRYVYLLKVNARGGKVWDRNYELGGRVYASDIVEDGNGGCIVAMYKYVGPRSGSHYDMLLLRIDCNGQVVWERSYMPGSRPSIVNVGDGFIVTGNDQPTFMIDADGEKVWEKNYTRELERLLESRKETTVGADSSIGTYDGGSILIRQLGAVYDGRGADAVLWRIDEGGEVIWATLLSSLSNGIAWWDYPNPQKPPKLFNVGGIVRGGKGNFALAGYIQPFRSWISWRPLRPESYILKFTDPALPLR